MSHTDVEPRDALEREFMDIVREGRRRVFEGVGAGIPLPFRQQVLEGIVLRNEQTGEPVATLADSDAQILRRFRRLCKQ